MVYERTTTRERLTTADVWENIEWGTHMGCLTIPQAHKNERGELDHIWCHFDDCGEEWDIEFNSLKELNQYIKGE